jgi:hypothetical protein
MAFGRARRSRPGAYLALVTFVLAFLLAAPAFAQRELLTKAGQKGQIIIDQISGFRGGVSGVVGAGGGGTLYPSVSYYGPIGFAVESYSQAAPPPRAPNSFVVTATTFWLAPSLDIFVINHLSLGGMIQIAYTTASESQPRNATQSQSTDLPSNTSFAILPRAGWMFPLTDRWAIWPRAALGYVSNAVGSVSAAGGNVAATGSSVSGFAIDLDVGVLFRVNETFFLRLAPELGWMPGAGNSVTVPGTPKPITEGASYLDFSLTGGIGIMFDL